MRSFLFRILAIASTFSAVQVMCASTPYELASVGLLAGRDLYRSEATSDQSSFKDQWDRMVRIVNVSQPIFADSASESIWEEAQGDAKRALAELARIAQIDNKKPSDWDAVVSGLKATFDDTKNKERTEYGGDFWLRVLAEVGKVGLQSEFREAESALDTKLAELEDTVRTPYVSEGIAISHWPSWQGAYNSDLLVFKNSTGRDLSAAACFIRIQGKNGSFKTHLHRALRWANNEELRFRYPFYDSSYASGQTVTVPARVDVAVFSQDMVIHGRKVWSQDDYAGVVKQYLSDVRVAGSFLGEYVEDGSGTTYYPGVKFSAKGLNRLPIKRIWVRFTRRGVVQDLYWDWNKYITPDDEIVLRSDKFASFGKSDPPDSKQIIFEFTDTSATVTYTL